MFALQFSSVTSGDRSLYTRKPELEKITTSFVYGWKDQYGSPAGLFDAAGGDEYGNVIYVILCSQVLNTGTVPDFFKVAMNYRLGAFGWLGGQQFTDDGGTPNLGLYDQRLAMEWVQEYIEEFGGTPERITVMEQSAGASSILHHVTAGGRDKFFLEPTFQKAIIQSVRFFPQPDPAYDDKIYYQYLNLTGAEDLDELVTLDSSILQSANAKMTFDSSYDTFNFGPTVDGDFVPDLPGKILGRGENHEGISLMVGQMAYDGLLFTPPWIRTNAQLKQHSAKLYPGIPKSVKSKITEMYPINPWIELAQKKITVVSDFLDDIAIQCNSYYLTEAALKSDYPAAVFRYSFNTLPAIHGYETGYTYYPSPSPMDAEGEDVWNMYESGTRKVMNLGKPGQAKQDFSYATGDDLMDRDKCAYWQSAPY
ncbi:Alpha/Beta hydrolase protein [Rhexocercosporidium sp. MPI-PUGE-AT-0058]|nr:Alpha/Beta hydrolase protein [Rhexocercosporidium sp. MPI-PUGE-AT-0058]